MRPRRATSRETIGAAAGTTRFSYRHRREAAFDAFTDAFKPRREAQRAAEFRLIDEETGTIGCDFEKRAARFAEIDGAEVEAVDDPGDVHAGLFQFFAPLELGGVIGDAKGGVMNHPRAQAAALGVRRCDDIDQGGVLLKARAVAFGGCWRESENVREESRGAFYVRFAQGYRMQARFLTGDADEFDG